MTYRRRSKDDRKDAGIILADALLGIGLAAAFAAITSSALLEAQAMMERAERRAALLDAYEANAGAFVGMMPYEDRSIDIPASASTGSMRIDARARLYGNDRIETDIRAKEGGISLELAAVRAYPFASMEETAGRPLCSVDMMRRGEIAHIDPIRLPIDPLLPLTDLEVRDGRAYVSTDSAHAADPDFLIFDIRHPGAAAILSQIDTGPGISEVAIAGRYAYAAAASAAAQLHVIRIDAPDQISLVAKYSLPLPASSTPPTRGSAIAYMKGAVLLGTEKWDGDELDIIDVSSPAAPVKITGAETGSKVGSIYVDRLRSRAYAAAAGQEQLRTYDISSLPAIGLAGSFSPIGWERQEGRTIERFEDELAFGRT